MTTLPRSLACAAVTLCVTLAGCASMSDSGPVVQGEAGADGVQQGDPYVRLIPAPPQEGVNEVGLIDGFLTALGSFEDGDQAARAYLTPEQQREWQPSGTVLVYGDNAARGLELVDSDEAEGTAVVAMQTTQVATRSADGRYRPTDPGEEIDVEFHLHQVDGEWRIADLPEDVLLSSRDVERVYRSLNLYYYNANDSTLVPDTVLVPGSATTDLAMELTRRLLNGPTSWLEPAVRTAFPAGTTVHSAYQAGRLTLDFSSEAAAAGPEERYLMTAQLAWTLRQVPGIQELLVRIDGAEIELTGIDDGPLSPASDEWDRVSPNGLGEDASAWFLHDGQLLRLDDENGEPAAVGAAATDPPLERHAVALDEDHVAGISAGGGEVLVAALNGDTVFAEVLGDGRYSDLSWDIYGNLWVAETLRPATGDDADDEDEGEDEREPASRLWLLRDGDTDPVEVDAGELDGLGTVTALRLSRDGTRLAVLTEEDDRSHLLLGRVIDHGDRVVADAFMPLATDIERVWDLAWRGPDQLAILGDNDRGSRHAYLVPAGGPNGSTTAGAPAGTEMETITAAPHQPLLAGADDGYLWLTNDRLTWDSVVAGATPVYPG